MTWRRAATAAAPLAIALAVVAGGAWRAGWWHPSHVTPARAVAAAEHAAAAAHVTPDPTPRQQLTAYAAKIDAAESPTQHIWAWIGPGSREATHQPCDLRYTKLTAGQCDKRRLAALQTDVSLYGHARAECKTTGQLALPALKPAQACDPRTRQLYADSPNRPPAPEPRPLSPAETPPRTLTPAEGRWCADHSTDTPGWSKRCV